MGNLRDERDMTIIKEHVTWNDVEEFVKWLAEKTNNFEGSTGVYGPARGGVTYAAIISNRYNLPYLGAPTVGCLCVDDICDTGDTALAWRRKGYKIATHYYKKDALVEPDFWLKTKDDKWIVFPWEKQD